MKRFENNIEGKGRKLCKLIKFTDKLNINVDTLYEGANLITYNLKAVVSHVGKEISGGHYIATTRFDASSDIWHTYSDSHCTAISSEQVQKQQAYLLFYEKVITTVKEQIGDGVSLNTLPISDIHYYQSDTQLLKLRFLDIHSNNPNLLGGIGSQENSREKNDSDNSSSENLPPTESTANVQRNRKRRLGKKVSQVKQNQNKHQHSTIPNTTTRTVEQSPKKGKRRKTDTKQKLKKKGKPVKKKKSKGKKQTVRDYKRENELRKIRRLKKKRKREEEVKKRQEKGRQEEIKKRKIKGREEELKKRQDTGYNKCEAKDQGA